MRGLRALPAAWRRATPCTWVQTASRSGRGPQCAIARTYFSLRTTESARNTYRRRAQTLQRALDADPNNGQRLAELLRTLNYFDPQESIRRFEQLEPRIALANSSAVREYIRALVLANRLDYVDLDLVLGRRPGEMQSFATAASAAAVGSASSEHQHLGTAGLASSAGGPVELKLPTMSEPLKVSIAESNKSHFWRLLRYSITMLIVAAGLSIFAEGLAGNVQKGIGMSTKKVQPVEDVNTTFDDVKGCDEVKDELQEIVLYLKDPDRFTRLGAKLPKGVMMSGAPGTGKTLLARAIAGEAGVPFLQASGSDFEEMFVGVGARRVRDLFAEARKHAPCIVFVDEIDAVGSKRSGRDNTAVRMTLNQLLVELDGFEQNNGIVVICATNLPESLDRALTRPGRLDKQVVVPVPDLKGRTEILELYAKKLKLATDVDLVTLAKRTAGMTGADLFNILNIAAVRCSATDMDCVSMKYLEDAFDRVVVGLERSNPMSDTEKRLTAYHEGGHTLVSVGSKGADPVHKATIMPRGNALGITWSIPDREKYSETVLELQARLEVLMGGKAAEELIFGTENVTAGCTSDLRQATGLARRMVMNFGMAGGTLAPFYMDIDDYAVLSDKAKHEIDEKTQELLTNAYSKAAGYLKDHEQELHHLAKALMEYETLSAEEINLAISGKADDIATIRDKHNSELQAAAKAEAGVEAATAAAPGRTQGGARGEEAPQPQPTAGGNGALASPVPSSGPAKAETATAANAVSPAVKAQQRSKVAAEEETSPVAADNRDPRDDTEQRE